MFLVSSFKAYFSSKFLKNSTACSSSLEILITWYQEQTLFNDFEMVDLVNIAIKFFNKFCIEFEGQFALDIMIENEL